MSEATARRAADRGQGTGARAPRPARRRSASDLTTTVLASIAIALPLMFYLRQHVEILRHGYEIEALEQRHAELQERSRELDVERAAAASLPEVERRASAMGLVAPDPRDVYVAAGTTGHGREHTDPVSAGSAGIALTASLE